MLKDKLIAAVREADNAVWTAKCAKAKKGKVLLYLGQMEVAAESLMAALLPEITTSCEDEHTEYVTFPDGLRLIFRDGEYAGWYVCGGA